jgi:hypothetical protein
MRCQEYCGDYLTFVGGYYEYVKYNPSEYIKNHAQPEPPLTQYTLRTYRGIPITVKFNMWDEKLDVGPTINGPKGDGNLG